MRPATFELRHALASEAVPDHRRHRRAAPGRRVCGAAPPRRRSLQAGPGRRGEAGDRSRAGDRGTAQADPAAGAACQRAQGPFRQCRRRHGRPDGRGAMGRRLAVVVGAAAGPGRGRQADPLQAGPGAGDRRRWRAQLGIQAGRRRRAAGGRTERRSASGGRSAQHHRRHAELHLPADRQDHQGRAGQGDGLGRFAQGSVLDRRHRDRQRRAAVARGFGPRTEGRRRERCQARGEGPERSSDLRWPDECDRPRCDDQRSAPGDDRRVDRLHFGAGARDRRTAARLRYVGRRQLRLRRRHRDLADQARDQRLQGLSRRRFGGRHAGADARQAAVAAGQAVAAPGRSRQMAGASGPARRVPAEDGTSGAGGQARCADRYSGGSGQARCANRYSGGSGQARCADRHSGASGQARGADRQPVAVSAAARRRSRSRRCRDHLSQGHDPRPRSCAADPQRRDHRAAVQGHAAGRDARAGRCGGGRRRQGGRHLHPGGRQAARHPGLARGRCERRAPGQAPEPVGQGQGGLDRRQRERDRCDPGTRRPAGQGRRSADLRAALHGIGDPGCRPLRPRRLHAHGNGDDAASRG